VVTEAVPSLTSSGPPILALPSLNCTVPATALGVTVAVSFNGAPCGAGEAVEVLKVVVVAATWIVFSRWRSVRDPTGRCRLPLDEQGSASHRGRDHENPRDEYGRYSFLPHDATSLAQVKTRWLTRIEDRQ